MFTMNEYFYGLGTLSGGRPSLFTWPVLAAVLVVPVGTLRGGILIWPVSAVLAVAVLAVAVGTL